MVNNCVGNVLQNGRMVNNCMGNVLQNGRVVNNSERKIVSLLLYLQTQSAAFTQYRMALRWHREILQYGAEADTI
jgi:archaellum component FlaF (FlaF/FlaG flagellin family)